MSRLSRTPISAVLVATTFLGACGDDPAQPTEPPNRAPVAAGTIPAQTVNVGQTATVDVSGYFDDPDGDLLTYAATTSNPGVATVSVTGSTVTVVAVMPGTMTVAVTATDPGGLSAQQSYAVTVPNRAPVAVDSIASLELAVGDTAKVDVSGYFNDPDGDSLTYAATTSNDGVASVSTTESTVTVVAVATGTMTVTVTATDPGGLSAQQSYAVTVPNRAPVAVDSIASLELAVGDTAKVEVSGYFDDPDGDSLTYAATTSDAGVADVSTTGSTVTVVAVTTGAMTVTVTATDPGGLSAQQSYAVTVPNRAPVVVDSIANLELAVGDTAKVEVSGYFDDPDGDSLTYAATTSDAGVADVSTTGSTVTVVAVTTGAMTVTVTATDPGGLSAQQSYAVTVPNRAPVVVDSILKLQLAEGDTANVDLLGYFDDPDGDSLTYTAASSNRAIAAVSASGNTIFIRTEFAGTATVTVIARDPGNLMAQQSFEIDVEGERAVVGTVTSCTSVGIPILGRQVTLRGTVYARRSVLDVKVHGRIDGSQAGVAMLGRLAAGQDKSFSFSKITTFPVGRPFCSVWVSWRERDDLPNVPEVTLETNPTDGPEGGVVTVRVLVWPRPDIPITVPYTRSIDGDAGTADADASDFAGGEKGVFEIAAGEGEAVAEIKINDDDELEPLQEFFRVTLDPPMADGGYGLGWVTSAVAYIEEGVCDRTPQVRDEIMLEARPSISECHHVGNRHLNGVRSLNLDPFFTRRDEITTLKQGDFMGLGWLRKLTLTGNQLTDLPASVFSDLVTLESLDLGYNRLSDLPDGLFSDRSELTTLRLNRNRLTDLPDGVFSDLSELKLLEVRGNRLTDLPDGVFSDLSELRILDVSENQLTELSADAFSDLSELTSLRLGENRIAELSANIFSGLSSLVTLRLTQNRLAELPPNLFSGLAGLSYLSLSRNELDDLPAGVFSGLSSLETLWLQVNPGAPFALTLQVERRDSENLQAPSPATVGVTLVEGAPFDMKLSLSVEGGVLSADSVVLKAGETRSTEVTVTQSAGSQVARINLVSPPEIPRGISGITIAVGDTLVLFGSSGQGAMPDRDVEYARTDILRNPLRLQPDRELKGTESTPIQRWSRPRRRRSNDSQPPTPHTRGAPYSSPSSRR